jgi:CRISPR-associated protein Cst2
MYKSLAVSGLLTLELHALNNEGSEGNTMMTRMVEIIDTSGKKRTVNAVSGDMFKHILVEHLLGEAEAGGHALCAACRKFSANRICADEGFTKDPSFTDKTPDSELLREVLKRCTVDDCAGILLTGKIGKDRSVARKSCIEFGWVVGRPEETTTESYFHAKYVPEGRGKGSGEGENLGQNIFHRPASSGRYAVVVNLDLYKIGRNDITLAYDLDEVERKKRTGALLRSLISTFIKPTGAHRNTQNPHVVDFSGVISTSTSTLPPPTVSALNPDSEAEIERIKNALNGLNGREPSVAVTVFKSLSQFTEEMANIVRQAAA